MYELKKQDFDNLLKFHAAINLDYSSFERGVLFSLASLFGMELALYVTCRRAGSGGLRVMDADSNSISGNIIKAYKSQFYREDPFIRDYFKLCRQFPKVNCFTDGMLPSGEYEHSEYSKFFSRCDFVHEAVIGVNGPYGDQIHLVKLYRTSAQGDFTEEEKNLLEYIGEVFNSGKLLYDRYLTQLRRIKIISDCGNEFPFGFAILDSDSQLIHSNSVFMSNIPKISGSLTVNDVIKDVIVTLTGTKRLPSENYFVIEGSKNGLKLTLQKKRIEYPELRAENVYLLTLKNEQSDDPLISTVSLGTDFGLTRREVEVVILLVQGRSNQEIADELYLGLSTVKSHVSNIYSKLGAKSRSEAMRILRDKINETL